MAISIEICTLRQLCFKLMNGPHLDTLILLGHLDLERHCSTGNVLVISFLRACV